MSERTQTEPSADMRAAAHSMREMYVALLDEGFNERQAVAIIGQAIAAGLSAQKPDEDDSG